MKRVGLGTNRDLRKRLCLVVFLCTLALCFSLLLTHTLALRLGQAVLAVELELGLLGRGRLEGAA